MRRAWSEVPTAYHLAGFYFLGPRINAGGCIGDAALGAKLLSTDEMTVGARIAILLDRLNRKRKEIEQAALEEALAMADRGLEATPDLAVVTVGSPDWHRGVRGADREPPTTSIQRPSCGDRVGQEPGGWHHRGHRVVAARCRASISAARCARAVAAGHLLKGSGHAMAAGLTVDQTKVGCAGRVLRDGAFKFGQEARGAVIAIDRRGAHAVCGQRGADRSARARRALRAGQSAAEASRSGASRGNWPSPSVRRIDL